MEPIESVEHRGFTIEIYQDPEPMDPRENDNLGTMVCFHPRYNLGDKHDWPNSIEGRVEFIEFIQKNDKALIALPLYLYDHSGLRIKIGSFQGLLPQGHAEFDTMKIGYIYVEKKKVQDQFGVKKWNRRIKDRAVGVLQSEVQSYDDYLNGNVFGYRIIDRCGNEVHSCWDFYPDHAEPGGSTNYVIKEAKAAAEACYRQSEDQYELPFMEEKKGDQGYVELT